MALTFYREFQQNTPLWHMARMGMATASSFKTVMARGRGAQESKTRERYMLNLADELVRVQPCLGYRNQYMEDGIEMQADAMVAYLAYAPVTDVQHDVAFIRNHSLLAGCSPDALVGKHGGVEIKTLIGPLMAKLLLNPDVPPEHLPQIQGSMLITERQWWDLFIYCPGYPPFLRRIDRDEQACSEILRELRSFNLELESMVKHLTGETLLTRRKILDQRLQECIEEEREAKIGNDCLSHAEG